MTSRRMLVGLVLNFVLMPALVASCAPRKTEDTGWRDEARQQGWSEESIAVLAEQRILITDDAYKQVFSAYMGSRMPLFITSDSLLNAYHILYEESILRLESARARRLPEVLKVILEHLEDADEGLSGQPQLVSGAKQRAQLVVGIALRLMDDSFRFEDKRLDAILDQEVPRVVQAEGMRLPQWVGPPDASLSGLDYSRYQPRGFYTASEPLSRYFRAVSWLQSIPFRLSEDEELLAVLMLGHCLTQVGRDGDTQEDIERFFRAYSSFLGMGDDWDLVTAARQTTSKHRLDLDGPDLQQIRDGFARLAESDGNAPLINDQVRFPPADANAVTEPNFRIISAYRTPSAILFQRTADLRQFARPYPDGLDVAAALGSNFARKTLSDPQKEKLLKTITDSKVHFQGSSLYFEYLDALETLLDDPEANSPDFMKTQAWQAKSCNTALAGWAQLRHTWVLQAKQTVHYLGAFMTRAGFVEPEPEFFAKMANLAVSTRDLLKQSGALEPDYTGLIGHLEAFRTVLLGVRSEGELRRKLFQATVVDGIGLDLAYGLMAKGPSKAARGSEAYCKETAEWIGTVITDIRRGQIEAHPEVRAALKEREYDLEVLWERFESISRQLEALARKQLRGVALDQRENAFIKGYGEMLAGIMLYGGNAYMTPRDDAPRVVDVYANPNEAGYLHVGIGRAREIYVLYPWQGKNMLCHGAVLPYYEFVSRARLTDESWKEMLDSEKRPPLRSWLAPIVSGGRLNPPEFKDRH